MVLVLGQWRSSQGYDISFLITNVHLEKFHKEEWLHILATGERKTSAAMIADALAAKTDESKPALAEHHNRTPGVTPGVTPVVWCNVLHHLPSGVKSGVIA